MDAPPPSSRLAVDLAALTANWQRFARASGAAACGAAIKANGYGLGARPVMDALAAAGCRDFFVAHWAEAAKIGPLPQGVRLAVLHGAGPGELPAALASPAVPVLCTPAQVQAWKTTGRPCDVMIDTGMNRLGLSPAEAMSGLLDGLLESRALHTLHSHLACADEPEHPLNAAQRSAFAAVAAHFPAVRHALANSAGIGLGAGYHFGLTRPGIGLYGGGQSPDGAPLAPVASLAARILQIRDVPAGASIGYGATFTTSRPSRIAIVSLGYADGYPRALSNKGLAHIAGTACPLVGRVSMDLTAFDITDAPAPLEGDDLAIAFDLAATADAARRSQYELLTGLGPRYARIYR